eukprot:3988906-Ditylum_brightwellii.AAC.1
MQLLSKICSVQKSLVEMIQKTVLAKDKKTDFITHNFDECLQNAIATHIGKSILAIVEVTINPLLQNKLIDKTISTTVGTNVSTITGDGQHKELTKKATPDESRVCTADTTPESETEFVEQVDKSTSKKAHIE